MKVQAAAKYLAALLCIGVLAFFQLDAAFAQDGDELSVKVARLVARVRAETARFHTVDAAVKAGYQLASECLADGNQGGIGQHYINGELLDDGVLAPLQPEALVCEPGPDDKLILVALEYLVPEDQWSSKAPPVLFGYVFYLAHDFPNMPPVWALYLWLWAHNPDGLFANYNATVFCAPDNATQIDTVDRPLLSSGVSGPIEQGDAGFGALAYPFLWRDAGVSGPVEQGDAGFD